VNESNLTGLRELEEKSRGYREMPSGKSIGIC